MTTTMIRARTNPAGADEYVIYVDAGRSESPDPHAVSAWNGKGTADDMALTHGHDHADLSDER